MKRKFLLFSAIAFSVAVLSACNCGTSSCSSTSSAAVAAEAETRAQAITSPAAAIEALKLGNERFVSGEMLTPRAQEARLVETLTSQKPFAAVIACSDSRVPVEIIFDQGIGDLFVIRTAGNTVGEDVVMGSIDYAIEHLEVPLVVVLGHQNCGGVTSAIAVSDHDHEAEHHGKIEELLEIIRADVKPYVGHPEKLSEAIAMNTAAQTQRIEDVKYIRKKIEEGKLEVVSAYYELESGKVIFE